MSLDSIRKELFFNGLNMKYGLNDIEITTIDDLKRKEQKIVKEKEEQKKKRVDKLNELKEREDDYNLNISPYKQDKYTKEVYKEYRKIYEERKDFLKTVYKWDRVYLKELNKHIIIENK